MIRRPDAPRYERSRCRRSRLRSARPLAAVAAALALSACAAQQGQEGVAQRAAPAPQRDMPVLLTVDPSEKERIALAREGQLETPLVLSPEVTGAPPPRERNPLGQTISAERLAASGVDTAPDVRVWQVRGRLGRLLYGPWPASEADLALTPGVEVVPN